MSNMSLKEQLQSLGLSTESADQKQNAKKKPKVGQESVKKSKPAWLEQAQYGVELLKAHFPSCFRDLKDLQPLKVGIKQDLVKHLGTREDIVISDKACMVNSLAYYVNSPAYHKRMTEGTVRIDLEGNPAGTVTADEAKYSIECQKNKLEKKKKNQQPSKKMDAHKEISK